MNFRFESSFANIRMLVSNANNMLECKENVCSTCENFYWQVAHENRLITGQKASIFGVLVVRREMRRLLLLMFYKYSWF